jgi:hypothetical protein
MRRLAVAAFLLALAMAACASSGDGSPSQAAASSTSPSPAASATATVSATHIPTPIPSIVLVSPAPVPTIDEAYPLSGFGTSHGAYSAIVLGDFGRQTFNGQGHCFWDRSGPTPSFQGIEGSWNTLLGEEVLLVVNETAKFIRDGAAPYQGAAGGTSEDPVAYAGTTVLRVTGLRVDPDSAEPSGADPSAYHASLGGRADTAALDLVVAYRCDPPGLLPTPVPPVPTPACPPADSPTGSFPPLPIVTLGRGSIVAVGDAGSVSLTTCSGSGVDDSPWLVPELGARLTRRAPLTLAIRGPETLFEAKVARYAAAAQGNGPLVLTPLGLRPGTTAGTFLIDAPPPGDWSVSVSVGINDVAHGAVWQSPFYFRITLLP